jgi:hypothetical protein
MKKTVIITGMLLGVGGIALAYLYQKNKQKKQDALAAGAAAATTAAGSAAAISDPGDGPSSPVTLDKEHQTFQDLSRILESDPVFASKAFPSDFYDAVKADYDLRKAGQPARYNNGDAYKTGGLPAAFMGVSDAWQSKMGFSESTHTKLWQIFSAYKAQYDKSMMLTM